MRLRDPHPSRGDAGSATLETAMVGGILLFLALGVIEFGNAYSVAHTLSSLSREGANIAARGTELTAAVDVVLANGDDIALSSVGGVVGTRILVVEGTPIVDRQVASAGYQERSRIGVVGDVATEVEGWQLVEGQAVFVMELFYTYDELTPLTALTGLVVPEELYERAVF